MNEDSALYIKNSKKKRECACVYVSVHLDTFIKCCVSSLKLKKKKLIAGYAINVTHVSKHESLKRII